jgi:hypothetical protein
MTTARTDHSTAGDGQRKPGRPGPHDFLNVDAHLSEEEKGIRAGVRSFVEDTAQHKRVVRESTFPARARARDGASPRAT